MSTPKMPEMKPPAPPPAAPAAGPTSVDFEAVDSASKTLAGKKTGKNKFKIKPSQNTLGTNFGSGTGLKIK